MEYKLTSSSWDEKEIKAINRVIASDFFTMNKEVFAFENQFAKYIGTKHAKMVNSGSSANLLMIASAILSPNIDLNPGDKVIVPAVSWSTTYFPLQQYGIKLIFVDVELETLNIDIKKVKKAIKNINGIKGILTVNLLGNPSNLEELKQVSVEEKIILFTEFFLIASRTLNVTIVFCSKSFFG